MWLFKALPGVLIVVEVANTSGMPSTNPDDGNATAGAKLFKAKCVLGLSISQPATLAVRPPTAWHASA